MVSPRVIPGRNYFMDYFFYCTYYPFYAHLIIICEDEDMAITAAMEELGVNSYIDNHWLVQNAGEFRDEDEEWARIDALPKLADYQLLSIIHITRDSHDYSRSADIEG